MSGTTRNLRDAEIYIEDGNSVPNQLLLPLTEGDAAWVQKQVSFIVLNRGRIDSRKQGDEAALDLSFTAKFEQWAYSYGNTGLSVPDVMHGQAAAIAAGWVSTDPCGPWAVTVRFRIYNPCNRAQWEDLIFRKYHADEVGFKEGNEYNTLSVKGMALQPTVESVKNY